MSQSSIETKYITKKAAAKYLGATPMFINLCLASGRLKSYRPRPNFLRFRIEDIDEFMRGQVGEEIVKNMRARGKAAQALRGQGK